MADMFILLVSEPREQQVALQKLHLNSFETDCSELVVKYKILIKTSYDFSIINL